jgi:AhpD family alkylhydroperoxidase
MTDLQLHTAWPEGFKKWLAASDAIYAADIDPKLLNLMMVRASQINGCAFCLDMHATDSLKAGEDLRRLATVAGWRDAGWFSVEEQTALELTEQVTRIGDGSAVDDDLVAQARKLFGDDGFTKLLFAIVIINGWNRLNITIHQPPA